MIKIALDQDYCAEVLEVKRTKTVDEYIDSRERWQDELRQLLHEQNLSGAFSWNSPSFKALGLAPDGLNDEILLQLMLQEPRLIRRPLVKIGDRLIIGGVQKGLDEVFL